MGKDDACPPQCVPSMSCHIIEPAGQIGNMKRLPALAWVESKVSLDLSGMTPLTAMTDDQ